MQPMTRRTWLAGTTAAVVACGDRSSSAETTPSAKTKSVAAIITAYQYGYHADVLIGKILQGWKQDGGVGPALKLASMYVEQFGPADMSRKLSKHFNVPIFDTIEKAITVGGDEIPVDGVISIGEHGEYPWNDKEQHLYPRKRFFEEITNTFRKYGRVVPVFNDKHLGPEWADAKWMYDRAQEMKVPFMAGSSLPLAFRNPDVTIPMDSAVEAAVGIGYSGLDIYGFHALECFQCLVERREGAEQGVRWVQCLQGPEMWKALDDGRVRHDLFEAAFTHLTDRENLTRLRAAPESALFLFQYHDGLLGAVFMLPDFVGGTAVAIKLKDDPKIVTTQFEERTEPRHPHFAYLLKAIEKMVHTGRPTYPVERAYLTGGILDRALTSRVQGFAKLETPELAIRYQPVDYPYAPRPELASAPNT